MEIRIKLEKFTLEEMASDEKKALSEATSQLDLAYAPYSRFRVGASVLMETGEIYGGSNQENASYPLCMCGERVALYHAISVQPHGTIKAIAITARSPSIRITSPIMPCGACRQVIKEYQSRNNKDITIMLLTEDDVVYRVNNIDQLLPFGFDASSL
jgi:cytidine deaminase